VGLIHGLLARFFPPQPESLDEVSPGRTTTVRGTVVPRDLIESPLTGEPCVYYQYTIEEWHTSNIVGAAAEGFWQVTERDEGILEFYVQDGRQRAIVAPLRARVERGRRVAMRIVDLGIVDRRAQQLVITAGDMVEVTAIADRVDDLFDEDRAYRSSPERIILRAPSGDQILIRLLER
jgi:hypothetical protein